MSRDRSSGEESIRKTLKSPEGSYPFMKLFVHTVDGRNPAG